MTEGDPLEDLLEEAEDAKEQYNQGRERLQSVRKQLHEHVDELVESGTLSEGAAEEIRDTIEKGDYGEARERIRENKLSFDDEEKDVFARNFEEAWEELEANVEQIRTELLRFDERLDSDDMVDYLYGKHSGLRKTDVRAVFEAFEDIEKTGLSTRQMARILSTFQHDLKIEPAEKILEYMQEEAES